MATSSGDRSFYYDSGAISVSRDKYNEEFKPFAYFLNYYSANGAGDIPSFVKHTLQCLHESFLTVPTGVKVLDYGAGPVISSTISAATKASEIVLADYTKKNLKCLQQWLNDEQGALDWSPHFTYVVQELEGKVKQEVEERQRVVRNLVKAVVHCDINKNPPIERGFDHHYDVVMCSLVLDATASTLDEYRSSVSRLSQLVKPGGSLFYYGVENRIGFYTVGDRNFPSLCVSDEFVIQAFHNAGFHDVSLCHSPNSTPDASYRFIKGTL